MSYQVTRKAIPQRSFPMCLREQFLLPRCFLSTSTTYLPPSKIKWSYMQMMCYCIPALFQPMTVIIYSRTWTCLFNRPKDGNCHSISWFPVTAFWSSNALRYGLRFSMHHFQCLGCTLVHLSWWYYFTSCPFSLGVYTAETGFSLFLIIK